MFCFYFCLGTWYIGIQMYNFVSEQTGILVSMYLLLIYLKGVDKKKEINCKCKWKISIYWEQNSVGYAQKNSNYL